MFDEIRRFENSSQEDFFDLLKVYDNNFEGESKAKPSEIVYWLDNISGNTELLIFGYYADNKPVAYIQLSYYKKENFACVDYVACEKEYRSLDKFIYSFTFILDYFKANYKNIVYIASEVIKENGSEMVKLLRRFSFRVANAFYKHPSLQPEESDKVLEAYLLIYSYKMENRIKKDELLMLIESIYKYSHIEWKEPFLKEIEFESYKRSINEIYEATMDSVRFNEYIELI